MTNTSNTLNHPLPVQTQYTLAWQGPGDLRQASQSVSKQPDARNRPQKSRILAASRSGRETRGAAQVGETPPSPSLGNHGPGAWSAGKTTCRRPAQPRCPMAVADRTAVVGASRVADGGRAVICRSARKKEGLFVVVPFCDRAMRGICRVFEVRAGVRGSVQWRFDGFSAGRTVYCGGGKASWRSGRLRVSSRA